MGLHESGTGARGNPDEIDVRTDVYSLGIKWPGSFSRAFRTSNYTGSKPLYQRAVDIQQAASPDNPELAHFIDDLASAWLAEGKYYLLSEP